MLGTAKGQSMGLRRTHTLELVVMELVVLERVLVLVGLVRIQMGLEY